MAQFYGRRNLHPLYKVTKDLTTFVDGFGFLTDVSFEFTCFFLRLHR